MSSPLSTCPDTRPVKITCEPHREWMDGPVWDEPLVYLVVDHFWTALCKHGNAFIGDDEGQARHTDTTFYCRKCDDEMKEWLAGLPPVYGFDDYDKADADWQAMERDERENPPEKAQDRS